MGQIIYVSEFGREQNQTAFAAHLATVLAEQSKAAIVDFSKQAQDLEMFIAQRHNFNLKNNQNLPVPTYFSYKQNLLEEISKKFDFIVLDSKKTELMKNADVVITLVDDENICQQLTSRTSELSNIFWGEKKARAANGKNTFDHVVIPSAFLKKEVLEHLQKNAPSMGYRLSPCLKTWDVYKKGLKSGITILDKNMPYFKKDFLEADFLARRNLKQILEFIWSEK